MIEVNGGQATSPVIPSLVCRYLIQSHQLLKHLGNAARVSERITHTWPLDQKLPIRSLFFLQPNKSGHHVLFLLDLWSSKRPAWSVKLLLLHTRVFVAQHFRLLYILIIDQFQRFKNLVLGFIMTTAPYLNSSFLLFTLVIAGTKFLNLKPPKEVRVHSGSQLGSRSLRWLITLLLESGGQEDWMPVLTCLSRRLSPPTLKRKVFNLN